MALQLQYQRADRYRRIPSQAGRPYAGLAVRGTDWNASQANRPNLHPYFVPLSAAPYNPRSLPNGWVRHVNYETGRFHYRREVSNAAAAGMLGPRENLRNTRHPLLNLKLNLPPHVPRWVANPRSSVSASQSMPGSSAMPALTPPPASCSSKEVEEATNLQATRASSSSRVITLVLKGCRRCLLYVMLNEDQEPKCPRCQNPDLVDFLNEHSREDNAAAANNNSNSNKKLRIH